MGKKGLMYSKLYSSPSIAAIVARVTTLKRILEYEPLLYNFRIQPMRIFRQEKPVFVRGVSSIVFTPRSADLCHAKVKRGEIYLLGGRVKGRRVFLTSCGLIRKWHSLEHIVRKAIRQGKLSCKCTVQGCDGQLCMLRKPRFKRPVSHSCEGISKKRKACFSKHGVCIFKNNRCKWAKRSQKLVKSCLSKVKKNYLPVVPWFHHSNSNLPPNIDLQIKVLSNWLA